MKVGDIIEIDGKKCLVTFVDGKNYSYGAYVEPKQTKAKEPEQLSFITEETGKKTRKKKV